MKYINSVWYVRSEKFHDEKIISFYEYDMTITGTRRGDTILEKS